MSQSRRHLLVGVAVAAAGFGCSHSPILKLVAESGKGILFPAASEDWRTRERINKIPYASMAVKIGRQPWALLILSRYDKLNLHWLSADRAALVTNAGRVIKTAGFPSNLISTISRDPDPVRLGTLHRVRDGYQLIRMVDIQPKDRVGVWVDSTFRVVGTESIEIADITFQTVRVTETNVARGLDWHFVNTYWADSQSGFVWKSVQYFVPELPPAQIEVLRPAESPPA